MPNQPEKDYDESLVTTDQTVFGAEEALMQGSFVPSQPRVVNEIKKPTPRWQIWLLLSFGLLLVVGGVMAWSLMGSAPATQQLLPDESPTPVPVTQTKWTRLIQALEADLQAGDPARPGFTFPQVDLKLQLDDPKL